MSILEKKYQYIPSLYIIVFAGFIFFSFTQVQAAPPPPGWKGDLIVNHEKQQCAYMSVWDDWGCYDKILDPGWEYYRISGTVTERMDRAEATCSELGYEMRAEYKAFKTKDSGRCDSYLEDKSLVDYIYDIPPSVAVSAVSLLVILLVGVLFLRIKNKKT